MKEDDGQIEKRYLGTFDGSVSREEFEFVFYSLGRHLPENQELLRLNVKRNELERTKGNIHGIVEVLCKLEGKRFLYDYEMKLGAQSEIICLTVNGETFGCRMRQKSV
ncbi:MAG: hypothetical protein PXY39_14260 [archaeon]|nr:hypothetical protein [archaeon]